MLAENFVHMYEMDRDRQMLQMFYTGRFGSDWALEPLGATSVIQFPIEKKKKNPARLCKLYAIIIYFLFCWIIELGLEFLPFYIII